VEQAPAALARQLEQLCIQIGDRAADEFGFVPIRELLNRFQVELIVRPLLVEGMLATIADVGDEARASRWAVLIDSDMHNLREDDIRTETSESPLQSRARNTIAHELAHSIALRPSQFGLNLTSKGGKAAADLVRAIERETERLSPFLLVTEKALRRFQSSTPGLLSLSALIALRRRLGVSREVFVSRLQMLRMNDQRGILEHTSFRNVAICVVEWNDTAAVIRKWPLFTNFDRNAIPDFLDRVRMQERSRAIDLEIPNQSALCGGPESAIAFECDVRVGGATRLERMNIVLEVESGRVGQNSLLLVRKSEPN
jgi:hypothetical protein